MLGGNGDEEQGNGHRHIFVMLQPQSQQHTAQEDDCDIDDLAVVFQNIFHVLHHRSTATILVHHCLVGQYEIVVEEGTEGVRHDEVDDERDGYQRRDENHPSEG